MGEPDPELARLDDSHKATIKAGTLHLISAQPIDPRADDWGPKVQKKKILRDLDYKGEGEKGIEKRLVENFL